jgi:uncharacterized protein (DUF3084 family)
MNELTYSELLELAKKARITLEAKIADLNTQNQSLKVIITERESIIDEKTKRIKELEKEFEKEQYKSKW